MELKSICWVFVAKGFGDVFTTEKDFTSITLNRAYLPKAQVFEKLQRCTHSTVPSVSGGLLVERTRYEKRPLYLGQPLERMS